MMPRFFKFILILSIFLNQLVYASGRFKTSWNCHFNQVDHHLYFDIYPYDNLRKGWPVYGILSAHYFQYLTEIRTRSGYKVPVISFSLKGSISEDNFIADFDISLVQDPESPDSLKGLMEYKAENTSQKYTLNCIKVSQ